MPYCVGPHAVPDYQRDVAFLDAPSPRKRRQLAAEAAAAAWTRPTGGPRQLARRLAGHRPPRCAAPRCSAPELTPREREVLAALASGRTNREIAELLGMSAKTVMHHSVAIYRKLGVAGRSAATAWAFQHGVVD